MGMLDSGLHHEGLPAIWPEWAMVTHCPCIRTLYKRVRITGRSADDVYIYTSSGWARLGTDANSTGPWGDSTGPFQEGYTLLEWANAQGYALYDERTGQQLKAETRPLFPRAPRGKK